jgi:hypothetical protein
MRICIKVPVSEGRRRRFNRELFSHGVRRIGEVFFALSVPVQIC